MTTTNWLPQEVPFAKAWLTSGADKQRVAQGPGHPLWKEDTVARRLAGEMIFYPCYSLLPGKKVGILNILVFLSFDEWSQGLQVGRTQHAALALDETRFLICGGVGGQLHRRSRPRRLRALRHGRAELRRGASHAIALEQWLRPRPWRRALRRRPVLQRSRLRQRCRGARLAGRRARERLVLEVRLPGIRGLRRRRCDGGGWRQPIPRRKFGKNR